MNLNNERGRSVAALMLGASLLATGALAQDIQQVPREETLVIAGPSDGQTTFNSPENANPYILLADIRTGIKSMYEPLFYYNVFQDELIPWLATGYEFNDDFTEITVNLREGVKWSDGEAFTADDLVFTAKLMEDSAAGTGELWNAQEFSLATASVEAVDDLTVKFTLEKPMPRYAKKFLVNYFGNGMFWLPEHIWSTVENPAEYKFYDPANGLPVTTSPWTLKLSSPTQIFLDRRDDWWGAETGFHELPAMKRIVGIPFVNTDRGAQLMVTNQADITMGYPTAALVQNIMRQNPKVTTFSGDQNPYGSLDWWVSSIWFNHKSENLPEPDVRRAIGLAVDRDLLIQVAYSGASEPSRHPFPAFTPLDPYIEVANSVADKHNAAVFDLEESARLMQEAGYEKDGDGFWAKDGERLQYEVEVIPPMRAVGPVIVQLLRKAGFDFAFVSSPETPGKLFSGNFDIGVFGHNGSIDSPLETMRMYHCDNAFELDSGITSRALARWCDEEYSALVDEFATYADGDPEAMPIFEKAMDIWYDQAVEIPLSQWYHRIPMNETHWTNYPSQDNPYLQPAFWYFTGQAGYLYLQLEPANEG
ncbi:MAG: ABC transporter substrate-binding protein [Rhodobacteraceae bacterium]|nr:ABC transporter substrate-binding protein [Paracoccaceae bacterium]